MDVRVNRSDAVRNSRVEPSCETKSVPNPLPRRIDIGNSLLNLITCDMHCHHLVEVAPPSGSGLSHPGFGSSDTIIKNCSKPLGAVVFRLALAPGPEGHEPKLAKPSVRQEYVRVEAAPNEVTMPASVISAAS